MFCTKCGKKFEDGLSSCPYCDGLSQTPTSTTNIPNIPNAFSPAAPSMSQNKKIAIIAAASAVVAIVITIVLMLVFTGNSEKHSETQYAKEVIEYLDFLAESDDDAEGFLTKFYMGGRFGSFFCGDDAVEEHEIIFNTMFKEEMFYGYNEYGYGANAWKKYLADFMEEMYEGIEDEVGNDWKLTYEITDSRELSEDEADELQETWEDLVKFYEEDVLEDTSRYCSRKDAKKLEELIDEMDGWKVEEAYSVEATVQIEGDDEVENVFEFMVAKVENEWVILDGPDPEDIFGN